MRHLILLCSLAVTACTSTDPATADDELDAAWASPTVSLPDVPVSVAPFDVVHVDWKQPLGEAYIYLNHVGDYRLAGARIAELFAEAKAQGAHLRGAPFLLFYDDPGKTPLDQLRARICVGLATDFSSLPPLYMDQLEARPVAYAAIGGAYSEVPRSYPGIFAYMAERGWSPGTPIREIYLVSPAGVPVEQLVTEVQIPWGS
ncbi:MAG: GyrI-like domain-containing protein [Planctomycetota bacterium]|nr:GyrI-like domain-containing protein [Planctomycetota bacterium]